MRSLALLLLLAAPAHAATFTTTFESVTGTYITDPNPCRIIGSINGGGGYTGTFSSAWTVSRAATTIPTEDRDCTGFGTLADWIDTDNGSGISVGLFRDAPSGTKAARICWDCTETPNPVEITFNKDFHFFSCYISGSMNWQAWACGSPYLLKFEDSLHDFNVHAISQEPGGLNPSNPFGTAYVQLRDANNVVRATTYPEQVDGWDGCTIEVDDYVQDYTSVYDPYCEWQYIELYSATPVRKVRFNVGGRYFDPLYVDNVTVTDGACGNPPCEFEGISGGGGGEGGGESSARVAPLRVTHAGAGGPRILIGPSQATPAARTSWGRLKVIYR